jgi:putative PIN family toxin of toxin-antitoxin system
VPIPQIVIDTNVLVAGLRSRRGSAFRLLTLVGTGRFDIHLSVPLVLEYEDVLLRELPHLQVSRTAVEDLLDFHCAVATCHSIFFLWRPFLRDPKDDMIVELAVKAGCDFIVTYNTRDFAGVEQFGLRAIGPGAFLQHIGALP